MERLRPQDFSVLDHIQKYTCHTTELQLATSDFKTTGLERG
jgi:hypothetical protein